MVDCAGYLNANDCVQASLCLSGWIWSVRLGVILRDLLFRNYFVRCIIFCEVFFFRFFTLIDDVHGIGQVIQDYTGKGL